MSSVSRKEAKARFCQWRRERVTQEYHDRCGEKRATQGKNGGLFCNPQCWTLLMIHYILRLLIIYSLIGHLVGVNQDKKPRLTHNSSSQVAPSKSLSIPTVTQVKPPSTTLPEAIIDNFYRMTLTGSTSRISPTTLLHLQQLFFPSLNMNRTWKKTGRMTMRMMD